LSTSAQDIDQFSTVSLLDLADILQQSEH